mgnify:CR=1 FL=1
MKKFIGFVIVLSLFIVGGSKVQAAINPSTPCDISASPSITVLSPNGGETFLAGQQIEVKWKSCNIDAKDEVYILLDQGSMTQVNSKNDGSEIVTLPSYWSNVSFGKNFKILVGKLGFPINDISDDTFTINKFENANDFPAGCLSNSGYSSITGKGCSSGSNLISYWYGKVNQHVDSQTNVWRTDPDGDSGADIDMLTYCKKWYPNTTKVEEYRKQTLVDWKERGNVNNHTSTRMAYKCVQGHVGQRPSIKIISPNGGENYKIGSTNHLTWSMSNFPSWDSNNQSVQIQLWDKNGQNLIGGICVSCTSSENGGSYNWTISQVIGPNDTYVNVIPGQYKIRISTVSDVPLPEYNYTLDFSDRPFTISEEDDIPITGRITLLSPQSGSRITAGSKVEVKWESSDLPPRHGNTLKMIIKRNGVLVREFRTEDDGEEVVTIPFATPNGQYQLEYGTISPSSGGGDHYVKYGSANFLVVTPINPIGCKTNELYSSTTGQKCFNIIEVEQKCDSASGCYSVPVARVLKIGAKGEDVKYIQTLLGITADGSYGPITASKVKEWQAQKKLKTDGIIGPQSISAMIQ